MAAIAVMTFGSAKAEIRQKTTLESENMMVWNRTSTDGCVKLHANISERDTTFTLEFTIRDTKSLVAVSKGDPLTVYFINGDTLQLNCVEGSSLMSGVEQQFYMIGYIPVWNNLKFKGIIPTYGVSREQLIRMIDGQVINLTFHSGDDIYTIDIRGNRFSETIGEECASLSVPKSRQMPNAKGLDITPEMLFGTAKLRRPAFHWNRTWGMSLGYNQFYTAYDMGRYGRCGKGMVSFDFLLKGFYWGMSIAGKDSNYDTDYRFVYATIKAGPALQYGTARTWLTLAPYVGVALNELYYDRKEITSKSQFLVGLRASYNYKHFEIGANASTKEAGMFVGYTF